MTKVDGKFSASDHENLENESTLNVFAKVGYAFGHVLNDLCATVWFSYTLLFFKFVLVMPSEAGTFMMIGQVTDAMFSAAVGFMTDRYSTKRNWHIMGTVFVVLSFPVLFVMQRDVLPYWANLFYFSLFITLFQCGWATVQISHLAILPELSTTQKDRNDLNSYRYCMTVVSNIAVFLIAWMGLHITNSSADRIGEGDFYKFRNIAILLTILGIVATIVFQFSLSKSKFRDIQQKSIVNNNNEMLCKPAKVKILSVLRNIELYKISLLYASSRLFLVISVMYIPIWLNEFNLENIENIALIPLIFYVASFIVAFLLKYIDKYISQKIIYTAGSLISISGCAWIMLSSQSDSLNVTDLFGIAVLLGAGSSTTQISSLCITADLIGKNVEHGGLIYSIVTVCDKLFAGIIIFVIEAMQSSESYYRDVLVFNGITAIIGLLVLATFSTKTVKS